jgi:acyl carrier protein
MNPEVADAALVAFLCAELRSIKATLPAEWPPTALFKEELGFDSLDLVELVARIEQRYGLMIPDSDLEGFVSLEALRAYITERA